MHVFLNITGGKILHLHVTYEYSSRGRNRKTEEEHNMKKNIRTKAKGNTPRNSINQN